MLHTLHDGSILRKIGAKELIKIPIWHGNRIIDNTHVQKIKEGIKGNIHKLDNGYHIITQSEIDAGGNQIQSSYIIDGQHRHRVIYEYFQENLCEPDFQLIIVEKHVKCEGEIISYFKEINNQMPILWKSDPTMLANEYINELCKAFNKKEILIRHKTTKRPYLSVDQLRSEFILNKDLMKDSPEDIQAFVNKVIGHNNRALDQADLEMIHMKKADADIIKKAVAHNFMLAVNPKIPWIKGCL